MFTYLLIAAELSVLYVVFWYLYVREPKCKHVIKGNLWGSYDDELTTDSADPTQPFAFGRDNYGLAYVTELARREDIRRLREAHRQEELVLDQITNHYVSPSALEGHSLLTRMAAKLDRTLSELNVKP